MKFEHHIFISYAHLDNEAVGGVHEGWVAELHTALRKRLQSKLGETPKIWRDKKLQGNDVFADTLVAELSRVGVMVSVFSPRYVESDWCRRELEEFSSVAQASGGLVISNRSRVFKVVKTDIPLDAQPEMARQLIGYDFFETDPDTGRTREYDKIFGPEAQMAFWRKVDDLAYDICALLQDLPKEAPGTDDGPRVFLADTTSDLKDQHAEVLRDLKRSGYTVFPDQHSLPLDAATLEAQLREEISRCRLSIHLVGQNYGIVPEGSDKSMVEIQHRIAREAAAAGQLSSLLWMARGLNTEDPRQREFIRQLKTDPTMLAGGDLLETTLEDLKTVADQKLQALSRPVAPPAAMGSADLQCVYVISDRDDLDAATPLCDHLFEQGFEVVQPVFDGDEAELRQDHEENLRVCDGVVLFYGSSKDLWLRGKLRALQKIAGYGRERPILAKAIYVAAPETDQKKRLRTREALVLRESGTFDPASLDAFIAQLRPDAKRSAG